MARPKRPPLQVCQLCGLDDAVTLESEGPDLWRFVCSDGPGHSGSPYFWYPRTHVASSIGRTGLGEELGVYDILLRCVEAAEIAEYGIVEYRFAEQSPDAYKTLIDTYGHGSLTEVRYTASAFLAHALGQLEREGLLVKSWVPATGYWSYLSKVSAWSLPGTVEPDQSSFAWTSFAIAHQVDPTSWPPTAGAEFDLHQRRNRQLRQ